MNERSSEAQLPDATTSGPASRSIEVSEAVRWFRLAEQDLAAALVLVRDGTVALRIAGFLAQQSAEKALKAGLISSGIQPPKIHGLASLSARYPAGSAPDVDASDLELLDPWVIDGRYAADLPDLGGAEADLLISAAQRIVDRVRAVVH